LLSARAKQAAPIVTDPSFRRVQQGFSE
jgi:hypothetical protein